MRSASVYAIHAQGQSQHPLIERGLENMSYFGILLGTRELEV